MRKKIRTTQSASGLLGLDRRLVWHPYTQMKDYQSLSPLLVSRAEGLKIFDNRGRWYYDLSSSWWSSILGHNAAGIKKAISRQMERFEHVIFAGTTNEPAVRLAKVLTDITHPGLKKVFYSDNGSTAVEVALKMSYQYWKNRGVKGKKKFVSLEHGYHGDTIGTMSVSGTSRFNSTFKGLLFRSFTIPSPYCYRCPEGTAPGSCVWRCLDPLMKLLEHSHREIAAIILEPVLQAAGGMIVQPKGYLDKLYAICREYDIHIILDEVATGFGRTGKLFGYQHSHIVPDFLCLSKSLTNGSLPMAATLTTDEIYAAFYDDYLKGKTFFHGHTFTGNPVSAAAALATVRMILDEKLVPAAQPAILHLKSRMKEFRQGPASGIIGDIRQVGLVSALELVSDRQSRKPLDSKLRFGWKVFLEGLKNNLIWRPLGDVLYFFLPLTVTKREIDDIVDRSHAVLNKSFRKYYKKRI